MGKSGKVRPNRYGIIHAWAQCNNCDWNEGIHIDDKNRMQKLRNKIYAHVKQTGHTVTLETGTSTDYSFISYEN